MSENREHLLYKKQTVLEKAGAEIVAKAYQYAEGYVKYLDAAKTEREAVAEGIKLAEAAGYRPYQFGDALKSASVRRISITVSVSPPLTSILPDLI